LAYASAEPCGWADGVNERHFSCGHAVDYCSSRHYVRSRGNAWAAVSAIIPAYVYSRITNLAPADLPGADVLYPPSNVFSKTICGEYARERTISGLPPFEQAVVLVERRRLPPRTGGTGYVCRLVEITPYRPVIFSRVLRCWLREKDSTLR